MASQIPNSVYRGARVEPTKAAPTKAAPSKDAPTKAPSKVAKDAPSKSADQHKPTPRPGVQPPQPGHPPLHRIPIVDHKGNMRGHVGHSATQATVARFLGRHGAKLGEHEGRTAWIGDVPPPPPPPPPLPGMPPMEAAKGEAEIGLINARRDALIGKGAKPPAKPGAKPKPK